MVVLSPFDVHDSPLERSLRGLRWKRQFLDRFFTGGRFSKKRRLGPQNSSRSLGPEKLLKIVNCAIIKETERTVRITRGYPRGISGWPPISTWIIPPPLGSNGPHCVEFLHEMRELLLHLVPGEPLALVTKLSYFDNSIQLDILLASVLDLCVQ